MCPSVEWDIRVQGLPLDKDGPLLLYSLQGGNMTKSRGLRFEKFDLHVHTPASFDFGDKSVTAKQIVDQALSQGLRGIAVTDHATGAFVDSIKKAAAGTGLVVFPGIEIACSAGKSGIHVIALLPRDKGELHVRSLLTDLGIGPDKVGKEGATSPKSLPDVIDIISSSSHKGIAVLAHCTSSKGALQDISGEVRRLAFESAGLLAVESSKDNFMDAEKEKKGTRAIDLVSGADPNYCCRKLAVYISSDSRATPADPAHNLQGIGARWTYFKVDQDPSLESLRQCFIDRDARIRQSFEWEEANPPRLTQLRVTGGFFDGETAVFHEGLNSILGAKGAGKSLLVELIRFALGQPPDHVRIREDHDRKLESRLQTYGRVALSFIDRAGEECEIERTYDPEGGNPYSGKDQQAQVESFGAIFLSQNEIIQIAEEENLQIAFIDRFFDFRHYRDRIRVLRQDLQGLDSRFAEELRAIHGASGVKKDVDACTSRLEQVEKLLKDPIYEQFKRLEEKNRAFVEQQGLLENLQELLARQKGELAELTIPKLADDVADDPALLRTQDIVEGALKAADDNLQSATDRALDAAARAAAEHGKWKPQFDVEHEKYREHVRTAGGDRKALEKQRLQLVQQRTDLLAREKKLLEKRRELTRIGDERDRKIDRLFEVFKEYTAERKAKCERFVTESNGRLQVDLHESSNKAEFKAALLEMKRGTYLRDAEIEQLCERTTPRDLIIEILRYDYEKVRGVENGAKKRIESLAQATGIDEEHMLSLCEFLLGQVKYEDLLALQYRVHPADRPEIRFEVAPGQYELIRDISVGQKCTAMMIIALSEGAFPIVIDQPEDSLDVRSVWQDMCTRLRGKKDSRQFILTTHNSCLAVASDTDKYIVIEGGTDKGSIVACGALESGSVRNEVINYLEGGQDTYDTKSAKYGPR